MVLSDTTLNDESSDTAGQLVPNVGRTSIPHRDTLLAEHGAVKCRYMCILVCGKAKGVVLS